MQIKNLFKKTHYESPRGLFALDVEQIEGKPNLSRVDVKIIDGTSYPLIYDAAIRRPANTPTWKQLKDLEGLPEGLQELLNGAGLAVPECHDCNYTTRIQGSDKGRQAFGCPVDGSYMAEGCKKALCPYFNEIPAARRKQEEAERADEIRAEKEYEEMQRLEELERKERERLRRKYGRDDNQKEEY